MSKKALPHCSTFLIVHFVCTHVSNHIAVITSFTSTLTGIICHINRTVSFHHSRSAHAIAEDIRTAHPWFYLASLLWARPDSYIIAAADIFILSFPQRQLMGQLLSSCAQLCICVAWLRCTVVPS